MIFADEPAFPVFGAWEAPGPGAGAMVFAVDAEARVLMQLRGLEAYRPVSCSSLQPEDFLHH